MALKITLPGSCFCGKELRNFVWQDGSSLSHMVSCDIMSAVGGWGAVAGGPASSLAFPLSYWCLGGVARRLSSWGSCHSPGSSGFLHVEQESHTSDMADSGAKSKCSKRQEVQVAWAQKLEQGIFRHTLLVEQSESPRVQAEGT